MSENAQSGLDDLCGLCNKSKLPYLSQTIDYETDIAPYPFIGIYAGVGSGKNCLIDSLAQGHTDPDENGDVQHFPEQTILLITSRRAKVNEMHNDKTVRKDHWIGQWDSGIIGAYDDLEDFEDALSHMRTIDCSSDPLNTGTTTIYQRYLPCTSAAIESYLRKHYCKKDSTTHLWNRFDMIVFDEAHTIRSDANYQTAPYFTMRLLQETYRAQQEGLTNCKIVLMTGTPSALADFHAPKKYHLIDRMTSCCNVVPKSIVFIDRQQSRCLAQKMLLEGTRCVFFFNRTKELLSFLKDVKEKHPSFASGIAVSFSDKAKRKTLKQSSRDDYDRMEKTEKYIAQNQKLPDNIQLFLTTERNKEGINIKNADIRTMFVESHVESSVVQMAGRLRNGVDTLYIVTDSLEHEDYESKYEWSSTKDGKIIAIYNEQLEELFKHLQYNPDDAFTCAPQKNKRIDAFVSFVENKHPYIIFDPIFLRFRLYRDRHRSKMYYERQNTLFNEAKSDPEKLCALVRNWYPNVEISVECSAKLQIAQYIEHRGLIGIEITSSQQEELLAFINHLTMQSRKKLGPALKAYGFRFTPKNKHRGCSGTIQIIAEHS